MDKQIKKNQIKAYLIVLKDIIEKYEKGEIDEISFAVHMRDMLNSANTGFKWFIYPNEFDSESDEKFWRETYPNQAKMSDLIQEEFLRNRL